MNATSRVTSFFFFSRICCACKFKTKIPSGFVGLTGRRGPAALSPSKSIIESEVGEVRYWDQAAMEKLRRKCDYKVEAS